MKPSYHLAALVIPSLFLGAIVFAQDAKQVVHTQPFDYSKNVQTIYPEENPFALDFSKLTILTNKISENVGEQTESHALAMPASQKNDIFNCEIRVDATREKQYEIISGMTSYSGQKFLVRRCEASEKCIRAVVGVFTSPGQPILRLICRQIKTVRTTVNLDSLRGDDETKVRQCQSAGGTLRIFNQYAGTDTCQNMITAPTFAQLRKQLEDQALNLFIRAVKK